MDIKSILQTEHLILKLISMLKRQQFGCATKCSTENVAKGKKNLMCYAYEKKIQDTNRY